MNSNKVVITAALTGSATTKEHHPAVPYTPEEVAREAKRAEEAGASVIHIHFRDPDTGKPTTDPKIMAAVMDAVKQSTRALINLSTGVGLDSSHDERIRPVVDQSPDLASLNPGTMNFCTVNYKTGEVISDRTYHNPLNATIRFGEQMKKNRVKPEIECFAISHVQNTLFFHEKYDFLDSPLHFSFVFGVMGGVRFSVEVLNAFMHVAPPGATWQGVGTGLSCYPVAMASAIFGGHIRVGLEDNIYLDVVSKEKSKGNWDQVEKAVQIARLAGREPASPEEARTILSLPGK
jgi:3-keto-5-aminohexanoate cleavage enzyme